MFAVSIRWPSNGWTSPATGPEAGAAGAAKSSSRRSISGSTCGSAQGPLFVARRRRCSPRSKAGGARRVRAPPTPPRSGLEGDPTLINNVETFANVPAIIRNGAGVVRRHRHGGSKGTKVFSLTGKVRNTGLVEVPMGTTLRSIVEEIGGGCLRWPHDQGGADRRAFGRAASRPSALDTPVDYESLQKVGSIMGSGGMIVMDQDTNMVGRGEVLHGILQGRVVRQVHPLPRRHRAAGRILAQDHRGKSDTPRPGPAGVALRHGQAHQPLWPGPDGAEPCAEHIALFPQTSTWRSSRMGHAQALEAASPAVIGT